jgi:hypothetical protein
MCRLGNIALQPMPNCIWRLILFQSSSSPLQSIWDSWLRTVAPISALARCPGFVLHTPNFAARPSLCPPARGEKLQKGIFPYGQRPRGWGSVFAPMLVFPISASVRPFLPPAATTTPTESFAIELIAISILWWFGLSLVRATLLTDEVVPVNTPLAQGADKGLSGFRSFSWRS